MKLLLRSLLIFALCFAVEAGDIKPSEAASHLNEMATVVGTVVQAVERKGHFFINFDLPYPQHTFTGFVPRPSITSAGGEAFLASLHGKTVAISGMITEYKGRPEIKISSRKQIVIR